MRNELDARRHIIKEPMIVRFTSQVTVEESMVFESIFEPELQLDIEEKAELFNQCEVTFMTVNGQLAGEIYSINVPDLILEGVEDPDDQKIIDDIKYIDDASYLHSTSILPEYRGLHLAKAFKAFHNGKLAGMGYKNVVGHSTSKEMHQINEALGAVHIRNHENWYETGRLSSFYVLKLD
jgi:hypothetical protein